MLQLDTILERVPLLTPENPNKPSAVINGKSSGILNWNEVRNSLSFERYKELLGNFWTPFEINLGDDIKQYSFFSDKEKSVFRKINGLVAILDSVQPRLIAALGEFISDSAIQANFYLLCQQEVIHDHSYAYILSSVETQENQNIAFETARSEKIIYERNKLITEVYENIRKENVTVKDFLEAVVASITLEGINFYSAFAYFYNLARNQKMMKTSTIISYINKDELLHTKIITEVLNEIIEENPHLYDHVKTFATDFFKKVVEKEIEWANYILSDEEDIDMFEMEDYIQYRANKCLSMIRIEPIYNVGDNPMPWIRTYEIENLDLGKSDFFEQRSRQYVKINDDNGFDDL
ncbi:ribonucleotide-diphosphate reductase subunit beta [Niallia taxi]|uniref:ribonucleotide-diphosphate reductase subunit beta n=1 Tax=Niallia taxi TaxID=2499688 RepID=UPI003175363E